ncbi:solute carrier family 2, facilitated glucose transporter member 3-like [Mizuhopecten yessoensis]|uniref:solute carrier family 2, facilitated glucose transporter member 3-like n=1 Tax=Mizuhopecten yessoensis TaxID=6573 RepID=UPI000B459FC7|nr:solute carrier family 2, facilitated glucose transporter member 3-like [Mizuhopecten yessoensis]
MERKPLLSSGSDSDFDDLGNSSNFNGDRGNDINAISVTVEKKRSVTSSLAFAITSCTLGSSFVVGYNTGVLNEPAEVIQDFYNSTYYNRNGEYMSSSLLTLLWSFTVSIFAIGGMIGGLSGGYVANRFGRRGGLLRNNLLNLIASGLLISSKFAKSYEMLIAGRFVAGLCSGIDTAIVPLYLSETAPISLRGLAGTFNQLAICLGILISQIIGLGQFLSTPDLWHYLLGCTLVPMVFQLLTLPWCVESPSYLMINKGSENMAEQALVWLRKDTDIYDEIGEMKTEMEKSKKAAKFHFTDLFKRQELLTPLVISLVLQLSQQFSGINAVIYYSTLIFESAGLSQLNAQYATLGTGAVNVLMTFVSAIIMDRVGRRTLHLVGLGGMLVFGTVLSLALIFQDDASWLSYVSIAAVMAYIVSFATGPGSIPWFYVAELFAQGPRSAAVSLSVLTNWLANFTVGLSYPEIQKAITSYSFLPFVGMLVLFWLFTFFKVPETKGKTIEEIVSSFKSREEKQIQNPGDKSYQRLTEEDDD